MFGRQRRTKPLSLAFPVLLSHQLHHPPTKFLRLGSRTDSSRTAMLQPLGPFLAIPLPQPLRLPVTYSHQTRCIPHLQLLALHSRQHFHTSQFPLAHPDSPHPASFRGRSLGDISIEDKRGHYHRGTTQLLSNPECLGRSRVPASIWVCRYLTIRKIHARRWRPHGEAGAA